MAIVAVIILFSFSVAFSVVIILDNTHADKKLKALESRQRNVLDSIDRINEDVQHLSHQNAELNRENQLLCRERNFARHRERLLNRHINKLKADLRHKEAMLRRR